jgi:hypothetical protein
MDRNVHIIRARVIRCRRRRRIVNASALAVLTNVDSSGIMQGCR